jgi:putative Holliday junction resolvase
MPVVPLEDLEACFAKRQRLLGLDLGTKTIGLALSDGIGMVATPLETIQRTKFAADARALTEIVTKRGVGGLVLGLPINMDGSEGPRCQSVRQFAANLETVAGPVLAALPVAFWDERLSSAAVNRLMIDADYTRAKRADLVDKMAAAYILQGALDRLRVMRTTAPA